MWALGILEDDLEKLYWNTSRYALVKKVELTMGEKSAVALSNFTSVHAVARQALGGKDDTPPPRGMVRSRNPEPAREDQLEAWAAQVNASLRY